MLPKGMMIKMIHFGMPISEKFAKTRAAIEIGRSRTMILWTLAGTLAKTMMKENR